GGASQTAGVLNAVNGFASGNPVAETSAPAFTYVWNNNLQIGSPLAEDVKALQTALAQDGDYHGDLTGGFYNQTYAAVRAFQEKHGINATGFVGPLTRAELNTLFGR
ncbi:peptidoglycan-binding protein, partial [Patescibacteria group bacterium]